MNDNARQKAEAGYERQTLSRQPLTIEKPPPPSLVPPFAIRVLFAAQYYAI